MWSFQWADHELIWWTKWREYFFIMNIGLNTEVYLYDFINSHLSNILSCDKPCWVNGFWLYIHLLWCTNLKKFLDLNVLSSIQFAIRKLFMYWMDYLCNRHSTLKFLHVHSIIDIFWHPKKISTTPTANIFLGNGFNSHAIKFMQFFIIKHQDSLTDKS